MSYSGLEQIYIFILEIGEFWQSPWLRLRFIFPFELLGAGNEEEMCGEAVRLVFRLLCRLGLLRERVRRSFFSQGFGTQ